MLNDNVLKYFYFDFCSSCAESTIPQITDVTVQISSKVNEPLTSLARARIVLVNCCPNLACTRSLLANLYSALASAYISLVNTSPPSQAHASRSLIRAPPSRALVSTLASSSDSLAEYINHLFMTFLLFTYIRKETQWVE